MRRVWAAALLAAAGIGLAACPGGSENGGGGAAQASDAGGAVVERGSWRNGPRGLYYMQRMWIATRSLEQDAYLFAGDRFAQSPQGNLANFDFDGAPPERAGRWSLDGQTMTLTWNNGDSEASEVEVEAGNTGCFYWNTGSFCPAEPFATAALDGTYEGGVYMQTGSGTVNTSNTYAFRPDGTYQLGSAASVGFGGTDSAGQDAGRAGATGGETGRYRIDGLSLVLQPDGGAQRRETAFPFGDDVDTAQPERIFFGGIMLKRQ